MAQYKTVFHTLAKILPRHEIDSLDNKYGQGDRRRKTSRYVQLMTKLDGEREGNYSAPLKKSCFFRLFSCISKQ